MEEQNNQQYDPTTKFCKFCAARIPIDAVICTGCGRQVETVQQAQQAQPQIVINNSNNNVNTNNNTNNVGNGAVIGKPKNKWVSLALCLSFGFVGAHKFYEGKAGMGILYACTVGLCFIGVVIDAIAILGKPNPYYV